MPSAKKITLKESYLDSLEKSPDFIMTRFSGLDVESMTELRAKLREKGIEYKVIKNRIFKLALKEKGLPEGFVEDDLRDPVGVAFTGSDLPAGAKVLKDFGKGKDDFKIMAGVLEAKYYDEKQIEGFANLPSKEQLLATIAAGLNAPATQIAMLMKQIMSSLARGIQEVGKKNG